MGAFLSSLQSSSMDVGLLAGGAAAGYFLLPGRISFITTPIEGAIAGAGAGAVALYIKNAVGSKSS